MWDYKMETKDCMARLGYNLATLGCMKEMLDYTLATEGYRRAMLDYT